MDMSSRLTALESGRDRGVEGLSGTQQIPLIVLPMSRTRSASNPTSPLTTWKRSLCCGSMASRAWAARSPVRPITTTRAPDSNNAVAIPSPIPLVPPVTARVDPRNGCALGAGC